jgi:hypothetical protein
MTLYLPLDQPTTIDNSLTIYNVAATGGWVKGPHISGKIVPPGGDWARALPSGVVRLDVRLTLHTVDGALIYISYTGVERDLPVDSKQPPTEGTATGTDGVEVLLIAPTFETASPKYAWLNDVLAVGKMVEYHDGAKGYIKYSVFAIH